MPAKLVLALALSLPAALADIPAHCIQTDVLGTWTFALGDVVDAGDVRAMCPSPEPAGAAAAAVSTVTITLSAEMSAVDGDGNAGFWTMVYDQGLHAPRSRDEQASPLSL